MKKNILKAFVLGSYVLMIGMNALANIIPINGITTGAVSDSYFNLFAPAGITFSIWGIIYLLLAGVVVIQFEVLPPTKEKFDFESFRPIAWLFGISSLVNAVWILAWHYDRIGWSLVLMLIILGCLIRIDRLGKNQPSLIKIAFGVYFGWIVIATIANVTTFLVSIGWNEWGIADSVWMIIILLIGLVISSVTFWKNRCIAFGAVIVWAYFGVFTKHTSPTGFDGTYPEIIVTVIVSIVLFVLFVIFLFVKDRKVLNK